MTWRDIDDDEVKHKAPYTTQLARAFRDNVVAAIKAALGAPRIKGNSLDTHVLTIDAINTVYTVTDLVHVGGFRVSGLFLYTGGSGGQGLQFATSSDNGANWSAWRRMSQEIEGSGPGGIIPDTPVDLLVGVIPGVPYSLSIYEDLTPFIFTPVTDANALRFRIDASATVQMLRMGVYITRAGENSYG
ncbi:hypothetical protein [Pseudooceanicola marinus]|uniref:hypothetical protein n=1 Tax=Pseudooceanicola marinus TaxID=396013 RepID=UPI001CD70E55|nr:hypothetical protein [Pseudooceanicola marinus]MCA1337352.1 hypothetical protein [Pseudooceanicola marinus]